jgi:predicted permease
MRVTPIELDHRVFAFTLVAASIGTLMFALLPALQASRMTLTEALHGQMSGALRGARLRSALVVGQVAVSLVLVIAALTLARNGAAVGAIDLGFQTHGVMSINLRREERQLVPRLAAALASNPRVGEVAVTGGNPLFIRSRAVAAAPSGAAAAVPTRYTFVSPEYFSILRIPIVGGRGFRADEDSVASRVAIVSAATARAFWPGENPVGKVVRIERPEGRPVDELAGYSELTIVGVVKDVVSGFMLDGQDSSHIYLPIRPTDAKAIAVLVRPRSEQDLTREALQRIFKEVVPDPQTFEAIPLEEMRATQMYPLRAASWVGSFLAAVALGLSLSGLYGVLTYTLSQRTKEIGIRMALGATAGRVIRLIVQQSSRMAGLGAVIGGAVAFALMRTLSAIVRFPTVSLVDLVAFGAGFAAVMAATAIAAYQPARRATRVDPAQALRADG